MAVARTRGGGSTREHISFGTNNARSAGGFFSIGNGENHPRAGMFLGPCKVKAVWLVLAYNADDTPTSGTTRIRFWRNDAEVAANLIAEGRISWPGGVAASQFRGRLNLFSGTVATASTTALTNEEAITEFDVAEGDVVVVEIEAYSVGLAAARAMVLTIVIER